MLIDFSITNFRSIKGKQVFSMMPVAKVKELPVNICTGEDFKLLKSMVIYGRNGSGKSNLLRAFKAVQNLVASSAEFKVKDDIDSYEPFRLDKATRKEPTQFEINFYAKDDFKYTYNVAFDQKNIVYESLYYYPGRKKAKLFVREYNKRMEVSETMSSVYKKIEDSLYPNQLFLSKVGSEKIDALIAPYSFLSTHLSAHIVHDTDYDNMLIQVITNLMTESEHAHIKNGIDKLLHVADIGIKGLSLKENKEEDFKFPESIDADTKKKILNELKYQIRTRHNLYENGKVVDEVEFKMEQESTGTKKLMALGGMIIEALSDGDVLIIDELDKSLHPLLTKALIKLFNNPKTNPKNAQLIFASHDVSLLTNEIFRRDQITFCEKNEEEASNYYSLADIKGVRKEVSYEKYYLKGVFGGTPVINEYELDFNISADETIQTT
ncbi:AAA family ATPase [Arachidicoccus soli]|uniref:ATP-binding protein n=1 Tax=Arachidicoccus soli TaxID=2341117 RepID=A0A386HPS7_9BACT|nr:ATP-binding protein [Arachidicoccus soli]AYD47947.1 ATP-binding protein [Arachidicoccus soli]